MDPFWTSRGKTIAGLIRELQTFDDPSLEVRISFDGGATSVPISTVARDFHGDTPYAIMSNDQDEPSVIDHDE